MTFGKSLCALGMLGMSVLSAHDTTQWGPLLPLTHVEGSQGACAMVSTGTHLYTAAKGELSVYSLRENPLQPRLVKVVKGFKGGRQMAINGDWLYLTARDYGLWIFDLHDRDNPKLAARFDSTELATGIAASGDLAYVAHRVYGTQILDVSNPAAPRHIATVRTREAQTVLAHDKLIFLGDWGSGELTIADVSNPASPRILSKTALDGYGDGLDVVGNLCIASTGHHSKKLGDAKNPAAFGMGHGIELIDISNPAAPKTLSVFKFPKFYWLGNDFWTVRICGQTAFAVDTHNGFFLLDISDRTNPRCLGHALLPGIPTLDPKANKKKPVNDCASSVALGDGCVYVTGLQTGLFVIPTDRSRYLPPPPPAVKLPPKTPVPDMPGFTRYDIADGFQVRRAAVSEPLRLAAFACSHAGVKLCRLSPDHGPEVIQTLPAECAYDVAFHDKRLFVAEGKDGIGIYDLGPDLKATLRLHYRQPFRNEWAQIIHLYKNGRYLAWHGRGSNFFLLDLADIDHPKPVFRHSNVGILYNDNLIDTDIDGVIACNHGHAQDLIDLNGDTPRLLVSPLTATRGNHNNAAYLAFRGKALTPNGNKLLVLDPKTFEKDTTPLFITADSTDFAGMPALDGNIMTLCTRSKGDIVTLDLTDLSHPRLVPERTLRNQHCIPDRPVFWQHRLIIPGGPDGVFIENPR